MNKKVKDVKMKKKIFTRISNQGKSGNKKIINKKIRNVNRKLGGKPSKDKPRLEENLKH